VSACDACKEGRHDECVDAGLSFHDILDAIPPACDCDEGDCADSVSMVCDSGFHNCPGCPCECHDDPKVREVWREAHRRYVGRLPISTAPSPLASAPPVDDAPPGWWVHDEDGDVAYVRREPFVDRFGSEWTGLTFEEFHHDSANCPYNLWVEAKHAIARGAGSERPTPVDDGDAT